MLKNNFATILKTYFKNYWWKLIIIAVVLLVDMLTKFLIVTEVSLIDGVLSITPTQNFGAGFSMLSGQTWLLITISILFLVGIVIFDIFFKRKSKLFGVATALIVCGALGNLIDRLAFGYVRDFIYLEFIDFPVFNVADIALTFGAVLFAIYILFFLDKTKKQNKKVVDCIKNSNANNNEIQDSKSNNNFADNGTKNHKENNKQMENTTDNIDNWYQ